MKKRRFIRTSLSIALVILVSSQLGIVHSAESMHTIQLTDYPSQVEVGDLMTIKGWVTFTQPTTNYPLYAVLVIEGSKIRGSAKWLPEGTVLESAVQLGTYTYDGNIRWVWYVPEIDTGVAYTICLLYTSDAADE